MSNKFVDTMLFLEEIQVWGFKSKAEGTNYVNSLISLYGETNDLMHDMTLLLNLICRKAPLSILMKR